MASLFSALSLGRHTLRNRIVRAPLPTGLASPGGFVADELIAYYTARARSGVGLIISEPISVIGLDMANVLALHDDNFISGLRQLCRAVQGHGAAMGALLSYPTLPRARVQSESLEPVRQAFMTAVWRACAAGFDAVLLHGADGVLLHQLLSPHSNHRSDAYGQGHAGRMQFPLEIVEELRRWLGHDVVLGYRMPADDLLPDGLTLQDARVFAHRLVAAGISLLDVVAGYPTGEEQFARFPGWQIPLAEAVRQLVDVPVIANGGLDDPQLAESVLKEGSADLIGIGGALDDNPLWPRHAAEVLGVPLQLPWSDPGMAT